MSPSKLKELEEFYDRRAWHLIKEYHEDRIKKYLKLLSGVKAKMILDIGCGNGDITEIIAKKVGAKTVVGIDISSKLLFLAREKGIQTIKLDLNSKRIPINIKFGLIICTEVLEHVFDPDHLLDEIYRLSKPDAKQIISVPNMAAWYNRLSLLFGWQLLKLDTSLKCKGYNPFSKDRNPYGHIRLFTKKSMVYLLAYHKLRVVKTESARLRHDSVLGNEIEKILPFSNMKTFIIFLTEIVCARTKQHDKKRGNTLTDLAYQVYQEIPHGLRSQKISEFQTQNAKQLINLKSP